MILLTNYHNSDDDDDDDNNNNNNFLVSQTGAVHTDYYNDSDLTLGSVINVWGRKFLICDCDDFTKEFYKSKYGVRK